MMYDACTDCGIEKTGKSRRSSERCKSCAQKIRTASPKYNANISAALKGITRTLDTRKKISLVQGGDGDILNRRYPGIKRWNRLVKERDGYLCPCGFQGTKGNNDVDAHHIISKASPVWGKILCAVLENGITLCRSCHNDVHSKEKENGIR